MIFNYTQPAEDAVDEALTGLKSALAVKIFGPDLDVLEEKQSRSRTCFARCPDSPSSRWSVNWASPACMIEVDREKIARYGINVSDVEAVIQAAVGGQAATQVIQGEKLFDLVVRMKPQYRSQRA